MSINKAVSTKAYHVQGTAFTKSAAGTGTILNRASSAIFNPSGGIFNPTHEESRSWATTGSLIDTTGTLLFNNETNGGYLREVLIANRGSNTTYIGFNGTTLAASGGFPLASGESMEREGVITAIWALAATGFSSIAAQGLFGFHSPTI